MRTSLVSILIANIVFFSLPGGAMAEIYKCKDEAGRQTFSDKPCGEKAEVVKIDARKPPQRRESSPFNCPSGISAAVNNLHYPTLTDVDEAVRLAESDHTNLRYRKLIKSVDPSDELPDRVSLIRAEGFPASEVPGFSNGVVVNVRICK